ncbi:MAG: hypothetical protein LR015_11985 [Verrucomicrobia bacterium]|nr:hypothetical protein [Verrucomicrobiota bacterium]
MPGSIDFALYPQTESDDFSIIVTSDPQPYELQHLEWYAQTALPEFRKHKSAVFGIACGDIVGDLLDLYTPYNKINALCGFPWYNVVGNHDLNFMAPDDTHAAETFRRVFGPTTYVFQYARVHFIILDNVYWEGFNGFRDDGWPNRNQYHGKIRQRDFDYIRNYLQHVDKGDRIVICSHIPLYNRADEHPRHGTPELTDLMQLLSPFRYTLSFSGHTHINHNHYLDAGQGYQAPDGATHHHCNLTSTCGSWYRGPVSDSGVPFSPGRDGSPKGYALVHFSGASDYKIEVLPLDFGGECHYGIDLPQVLATDELPSTSAQINVFCRIRKPGFKCVLTTEVGPIVRRYMDATGVSSNCVSAVWLIPMLDSVSSPILWLWIIYGNSICQPTCQLGGTNCMCALWATSAMSLRVNTIFGLSPTVPSCHHSARAPAPRALFERSESQHIDNRWSI